MAKRTPIAPITVPEVIEKDPIALVFWGQLLPELQSMGGRPLDVADFTRLCLEHSTYVTATETLQREGFTCPGSTGQPTASPWVKIRESAFDRIELMIRRMGLDQAARRSRGMVEDSR